MWEALLWVVCVPVGGLVVYVVSRFVSAAYFQSKLDYEKRMKSHGQKQKQE